MISINQDSSELYRKNNETNLLLVKTSFVSYKFINFIFEKVQNYFKYLKYILNCFIIHTYKISCIWKQVHLLLYGHYSVILF